MLLQQACLRSTKVIPLMQRRGVNFLFPQKTLDVYDDKRSAETGIYFLDDSAESFLALLLCDAHSTAVHLCATGFIYTLKTFI